MKKILYLLLAVSLMLVVGCKQKDKPYSYYTVGVPVESWGGAELSTYNIMSNYLISNGFINHGLVIEGEDEKLNDENAVIYYENKLQLLNEANESGILKEVMKGATSPGEITFDYNLFKGLQVPYTFKFTKITVKY